MFPIYPQAVLALADGTVFVGRSIGIVGSIQGEVVFNTGLTGYQEILTDPSYCGQIVTFTYPHIGNYGTNSQDVQSKRVEVAGLVIKDLAMHSSNFRNQVDLADYLRLNKVVAIAEIDTRKLTRILRTKGAQNGAIIALAEGQEVTAKLIEQAKHLAQITPSLVGKDLAKQVTTQQNYQWQQDGRSLTAGFNQQTDFKYHVVAFDYGVKQNILALLAERNCQITVVSAATSAEEILALHPDGIFLSNGPGDPQACDYAIATIEQLVEQQIPIFGICLGHQLLALALGAKTFKMKFGHHGSNHPVKDLTNNRVCITSQNHGFAVDAQSLPQELEVTHISLFDNTIQGLKHKSLPLFSFQGHPEAAPGPTDVTYLFDNFIGLMEDSKNA